MSLPRMSPCPCAVALQPETPLLCRDTPILGSLFTLTSYGHASESESLYRAPFCSALHMTKDPQTPVFSPHSTPEILENMRHSF